MVLHWLLFFTRLCCHCNQSWRGKSVTGTTCPLTHLSNYLSATETEITSNNVINKLMLVILETTRAVFPHNRFSVLSWELRLRWQITVAVGKLGVCTPNNIKWNHSVVLGSLLSLAVFYLWVKVRRYVTADKAPVPTNQREHCHGKLISIAFTTLSTILINVKTFKLSLFLTGGLVV